jgi:hypothetical protein
LTHLRKWRIIPSLLFNVRKMRQLADFAGPREQPLSWRLDHIQTTIGECPEKCAHCGAFPLGEGTGKMVSLSRDQLEKNLAQRVEGVVVEKLYEVRGGVQSLVSSVLYEGDLSEDEAGVKVDYGAPFDEGVEERYVVATRARLADFANNFVTTDVNTEPLVSDSFADMAELLDSLTEGASKAVCISHGVRVSRSGDTVGPMERRMKEIVRLMLTEKNGVPVIPIFVLSIDLARQNGEIPEDINMASYIRTLEMLRPVLERGKARVTVSVQGLDDNDHTLSKKKAVQMYQKIRTALANPKGDDPGWSADLVSRITMDEGRNYVHAGRAASFPGAHDRPFAPVIPDAHVNREMVDHLPSYTGFVDALGRVFRRSRDWKIGYKKLIEKEHWRRVETGSNPQPSTDEIPLRDLTLNWLRKYTDLFNKGGNDGGSGGGGAGGAGGADPEALIQIGGKGAGVVHGALEATVPGDSSAFLPGANECVGGGGGGGGFISEECGDPSVGEWGEKLHLGVGDTLRDHGRQSRWSPVGTSWAPGNQ